MLATVQAELTQATLQVEADEELAAQGLVSRIQLRQSQARAEDLETRDELEQERLQIATESVEVQMAVEQADVDRLMTLRRLRLDKVADLKVRAGLYGVLQQVPLEEGQRVTAGSNLARVGDPSLLKTELRIVETQAEDIQIGQSASIGTRNGIIPGHVVRIDPAVEKGTVTVDVPLPRGARSDLTVDRSIELERLDDVVFVSRPVFGQEHGVVSLFKLDADGDGATRTRVHLGRASVNTIEELD